MRNPKLADIYGIINKKYPFRLTEDWDNTGVQLGDLQVAVKKIMIALDPLPEVIDSAIQHKCDLLITHHPLIFSPVRQITTATTTGKSLLTAARNGLALLAMHTNYDIAPDGLNDLLAARIGLEQTAPLKTTWKEELVKLVVFVPMEQLEQLRSALFPFAVKIGNYSDCSFKASGEGTFRPLEGSTPHIGSKDQLEILPEERLEMLFTREMLPKAIKKLVSVHRYEEPAFDIYPLLNEAATKGIGRIGILPVPVQLRQLAEDVAQKLGCQAVRFTGDPEKIIRKVALCSGSGGSLLKDAARLGADLLLTGDLKYHEARDAEAQGIALIDAGHFQTEILMTTAVKEHLTREFIKNGYEADILTADTEKEPFQTVITKDQAAAKENRSEKTDRIIGRASGA